MNSQLNIYILWTFNTALPCISKEYLTCLYNLCSVFGFFKQELKKEESVNPHILQLGYLSGAIPTGISFFRVSSTPGSASKILTNTVLVQMMSTK